MLQNKAQIAYESIRGTLPFAFGMCTYLFTPPLLKSPGSAPYKEIHACNIHCHTPPPSPVHI